MCCDPLPPALCDLQAELPLSPDPLRSIPVPLRSRVAVRVTAHPLTLSPAPLPAAPSQAPPLPQALPEPRHKKREATALRAPRDFSDKTLTKPRKEKGREKEEKRKRKGREKEEGEKTLTKPRRKKGREKEEKRKREIAVASARAFSSNSGVGSFNSIYTAFYVFQLCYLISCDH